MAEKEAPLPVKKTISGKSPYMVNEDSDDEDEAKNPVVNIVIDDDISPMKIHNKYPTARISALPYQVYFCVFTF